MKISNKKWGDHKYMLIGMSKKVYKKMVKEMNIISLRKESSQQQCAHMYVIIDLFFYLHQI